MDDIYVNDSHVYRRKIGHTIKGGKGWAEDIPAEFMCIGCHCNGGSWFPNDRKNYYQRNSACLDLLPLSQFPFAEALYALINKS